MKSKMDRLILLVRTWASAIKPPFVSSRRLRRCAGEGAMASTTAFATLRNKPLMASAVNRRGLDLLAAGSAMIGAAAGCGWMSVS
jgi:hypothetical protein